MDKNTAAKPSERCANNNSINRDKQARHPLRRPLLSARSPADRARAVSIGLCANETRARFNRTGRNIYESLSSAPTGQGPAS